MWELIDIITTKSGSMCRSYHGAVAVVAVAALLGQAVRAGYTSREVSAGVQLPAAGSLTAVHTGGVGGI